MQKKLTKEKKLKKELEETRAALATAVRDKDTAKSMLDAVKQVVFPTKDPYMSRGDDLLASVSELVWFRKHYEGRYLPGRDHILSLEKILRWTINPESAKDDEKIARFEEERNRRGGMYP